ncbi:MAG: DUF4116 domain-containing protein, partial [Desulfovibrio sp.]|nr:DUF4116 domain-containing protein [Desulfovibrio sp.]
AVKMNGGNLGYVPELLRTPELCWTATMQSGLALESVPPALRTPEICLNAVRISGVVLACVPDGIKTPEICMAAVKSDGTALSDVPNRLKTPEICGAAITEAGELAYDFLPPYFVKMLRTGVSCKEYEEQRDRIFCAFWTAYGAGDEAERARAFTAFAAIPMSLELGGRIVGKALQEGGASAAPASEWLWDGYMAGRFDPPLTASTSSHGEDILTTVDGRRFP